MRKRHSFLFILFLVFTSASSPAQVSDSLSVKLRTARNVEDSVNAYLSASKKHHYSDLGKAKLLAETAYQLAVKRGFNKGIGLALSNQGVILSLEYKTEEALKYLKKALVILKQIQAPELSETYNSLGITYAFREEPVRALENYLSGVEIALNYNNTKSLASLYINISTLYSRYNKPEESKRFAEKALELAKKLKVRKYLVFSYSTLASYHFSKNNFAEAERNYREILNLYPEKPDDYLICKALTGMGDICAQQKKDEEALLYYKRSLEVHKDYPNPRSEAHAFRRLAEFHKERGDYGLCIENALQFFRLSEKIKDTYFQSMAALLLSEAYGKQNRLKEAWEYSGIYTRLNADYQTKLNELNATLFDKEVSRREQQLILERQQREIEALNAREKNRMFLNTILAGGLILFLLLSLFLLLFYRQKIRMKNISLQQANMQLAQEKAQKELEFRKRETEKLALFISEKNHFAAELKEKLSQLKGMLKEEKQLEKMMDILGFTSQSLTLTEERKEMEIYKDNYQNDFFFKLEEACPELNEYYRRFAVLIRLNIPTKEIASIMNITPKSVAMIKYRIRKKLNLPESQDLFEFFSKI